MISLEPYHPCLPRLLVCLEEVEGGEDPDTRRGEGLLVAIRRVLTRVHMRRCIHPDGANATLIAGFGGITQALGISLALPCQSTLGYPWLEEADQEADSRLGTELGKQSP